MAKDDRRSRARLYKMKRDPVCLYFVVRHRDRSLLPPADNRLALSHERMAWMSSAGIPGPAWD